MEKMKGWAVFVALVVGVLVQSALAVDLSNYSVRAYVMEGEKVAIGGFDVAPSTTHKLALRVRGPSLRDTVSEPLKDPVMFVYRGSTLVASNDNWESGEAAEELRSMGFAPTDALEPALVEVFPPGVYTVVVGGKDQQRGVALLEVVDRGLYWNVYDDFVGSLLDETRWIVEEGSPVVDQGYFYCRSETFNVSRQSYSCAVRSVAVSPSWTLSLVTAEPTGMSDGTIEMGMCVGTQGDFSVCALVEVQRDKTVCARVVKTDREGIPRETICVKNISESMPALVVSMIWNAAQRRLDFMWQQQGSSVIHSMATFIQSLDTVVEESPIFIRSYGTTPLAEVYPVAYVER